MNNRPALFFAEAEALPTGLVIRDHDVPKAGLSCGEETGKRKDDEPLDGALQVPRPVAWVGAFRQEELARRGRASEHEHLAALRRSDPFLYPLQFDIKNLLQVVAPESPEDDHLVHAIHELGREL